MPDGLYDRDIYQWSEQQADRLRRLAAGERPNDLDLPHIIEEIEALGRSELRAVESSLVGLMAHLLYLHCWPQHTAGGVWRYEVAEFLERAGDDHRPSMRATLDNEFGKLWTRARRGLAKKEAEMNQPMAVQPPVECPWTLDDLLNPQVTGDTLLAMVQP